MIVVDEDGALVADSAAPGARGNGVDYATRPEIAQALDGQSPKASAAATSSNEDLLFTAAPIIVDGRPEGAVRVTQSVDAVDREVRNDIIALIGVGIVALLLGLAVGLAARGLARQAPARPRGERAPRRPG